MAEYIIANTAELQPGQHKIVTIDRVQIGLFRIGDAFYALPNLCPHQRGPLCEGKLGGAILADAASGWQREWRFDGEVVTCPWHGMEFRVTTGQCLVSSKIRLRLYPLTIEGTWITITL